MDSSNGRRLLDLRFSVALLSVFAGICVPGASARSKPGEVIVLQQMAPKLDSAPPTQTKPMLQGRADVAAPLYSNVNQWQAAQYYKQGAAALAWQNVPMAAECFRIAGDGFAQSPNSGRFEGEARFAEAQTRRILRDNAKAAKLYGQAAELFRQYDPLSPYLKASMDQVAYLTGGVKKNKPLQGQVEATPEPTLKSIPAIVDHIDKTIPLTANVTKLAGGLKLDALKDGEFFNGGNQLPHAAAVNISDAYTKSAVYKAFADMTCLETAALGGNLYTAPDMYASFKVNGKAVAVGAADEMVSPSVKLTVNGKQSSVVMDLPNLNQHTKNVLLVTDGQHVLALDPRTKDTWKLVTNFKDNKADFAWWKLTHNKNVKYIPEKMKRLDYQAVAARNNQPPSLFSHNHPTTVAKD